MLSNYRRYARLADGEESNIRVSAAFSKDKVQNSNIDNNVEKALVRKLDAEEKFSGINYALNKLGYLSRKILRERYIIVEELTDTEIYISLNMSKRDYYRKLSKAQLEFAEAYNNGELLSE